MHGLRNGWWVLAALVCSCATAPAPYRPSENTAKLQVAEEGVLVAASLKDAAREVTRLLAARGFHLVDRSGEGPRVLVYRGVQPVSANGYVWETGSQFFARLSAASGGTRLQLHGEPFQSANPRCGTSRPSWLAPAPCQPSSVVFPSAVEADAIRGVVLELAEAGLTVGP
jgi:hypothetical protein